MKVNILCIGDIVGRPGRRIVAEKLKTLIKEREIDCVIANAENAAGGSGITPQIYQKLLKYGINIITLGDHTYRKKDIIPVLESSGDIVRPANFSQQAAGKDFAVYQTAKGVSIGVAVLIGRVFMKPSDCPFHAADSILSKRQKEADLFVFDMHAEATSEKIAMGYYLDGRASCVFGTHTHVMTADERILPKGTAYITDLGMTGSHDSVLGRKTENVVKAFRTQLPLPFEVATEDVRLSAILATIDSQTKRAEKIERIQLRLEGSDAVNYDSDDGKPEYQNEGF